MESPYNLADYYDNLPEGEDYPNTPKRVNRIFNDYPPRYGKTAFIKEEDVTEKIRREFIESEYEKIQEEKLNEQRRYALRFRGMIKHI